MVYRQNGIVASWMCSLRVNKEWGEKDVSSKSQRWDFPGSAVVKNPPANAGDTGSIPGPGRSHMPQSR